MTRKVALAVVYWALACGCSAPRDKPQERVIGDSGRLPDGSTPTVVDLPPCEPTLSSLRENVFSRTCQWSTCHGSGTPAWELLLTEDAAILSTVGARSVSCSPWLLVDPGSPDESLLYRKIADEEPPCGERMPWGVGILPPHAVACLRGWIESLDDAAGRDAARDAD